MHTKKGIRRDKWHVTPYTGCAGKRRCIVKPANTDAIVKITGWLFYAKISTKNQKDDLNSQTAFLKQYCNAKGIIIDRCIEDYGNGLNYNRKN